MESELRDNLQSALGSAYTVGRELGGGGMSRVFLVHEPALGRDVVVKVLHPALSDGVNTDRFKREIQLAAQLQHPHVVPILAAGETSGLPYLIMPFVAGRSLRERLAEHGALPLDEAVDILRDVARALAYAHGRGIIHRDIKPDNVLLAEGSATVTDFGVAKAVSAARDSASMTLTRAGTSIGTPTYMAPEQGAADPATDLRADIYAWGVMAYELLAGRPPFTHDSVHKLLAAHMSEAPVPITDLRRDCPPALSALVMQCLAKDPDQRPSSASEVLRTLAEVRTPSGSAAAALRAPGGAPPRSLARALILYGAVCLPVLLIALAAASVIGLPDWVLPAAIVLVMLGLPAVLFTWFVAHRSHVVRALPPVTTGGSMATHGTLSRIALRASPHVTWKRTMTAGVMCAVAFVLLVAGFMSLRALGIGPMGSLLAKGVMGENEQVLVADFDSPGADSTLGSVVSEGLRAGLGQSHAVRIVQPSAVLAALQRMQKPAGARLTPVLAREVAVREGIKAIVIGKLTPVGGSGAFILTAQLISATGDELASDQESAKDAGELIPAIDRAARALRGKVGESLRAVHESEHLERVTTPSLPALRKYTEGIRANTYERNYPKSIAALEEAVHLDTSFALAYRLASVVYGNAGLRPGRADTLRATAFALRERLPELERLLVEGNYYRYDPDHEDRERARVAFEHALELDPWQTSALSQVVLLYAARREYAKAEAAALQTAAFGSLFGLPNAARYQIAQGKRTAAIATLQEFDRRYPTNGYVGFHAAEWAALAEWDSVRVQSERVRLTGALQYKALAVHDLVLLAEIEGRLHDAARFEEESRRLDAQRGDHPDETDMELGKIKLEIRAREHATEALARLDSMTASPSARWTRTVPLRIAALYAEAGAPAKARAQVTAYSAAVRDTAQVRIDGVERRFADGQIAVAEKRYAAGIAALWSADTLYDGAPTTCESCMIVPLARAYDAAGQRDAALRMYERYARDSYNGRALNDDRFVRGPAFERLGQLYEEKGDKRHAALAYADFIDLWKNADAEFQPRVAAARKRLAALSTSEGR